MSDKKEFPDKGVENAYLQGAREWNERYGSYRSQAKVWQVIGPLCVIAGIACAAYAMYQSTQSNTYVYTMKMDGEGTPISIDAITASPVEDELVIKAQLARMVKYWRSVTADGKIQKERLTDLYKLVPASAPASKKLNEYFQTEGNNPLQRMSSELVSINIISVLTVSVESMEIEWWENVRDHAGDPLSRTKYEALIKYEIVPPSTKADVYKNPLGIRIIDITWSEKNITKGSKN